MFITSKKSCRTTKHFRVKCHLQLGCKIFNWNEKDILVKNDYYFIFLNTYVNIHTSNTYLLRYLYKYDGAYIR